MRLRFERTVSTLMKSSPATSALVLPLATKSATWRSVPVSWNGEGCLPPIRSRPFFARFDHKEAPSSSNMASAWPRDDRAAFFCFARRSTSPFTRSVRARSNGCGTSACSPTALSRDAIAPSASPPSASSRPRHRSAVARAHGRSSVVPRSIRRRARTSASSGRPSEINTSTASGTQGMIPGSAALNVSRYPRRGSRLRIAAG